MAILWQKRNLVTNADIGTPNNLPFELEGLDEFALSNLSWCTIVEYSGMGFFPVEVFDMPALIEQKLRQLNQAYKIVYDFGFSFEIKGNNEVLQMRQHDLINWLVFKDSCDDMIAEGLGNVITPLCIRCTSNKAYAVTANEGRAVMLALRAYGASLLAQLWAKKDLIEAAKTPEELAAISINFI